MTTTVKLPDPIPMVTSLTQALGKRRSHREFSAKPLSPDLLSTLLWSVAGISSETGLRTVPSAMDCREIVVFVFDQQGVWFYDAPNTSMIQTAEGDKRSETTLGQFFVAKAPVTLLFAADTTPQPWDLQVSRARVSTRHASHRSWVRTAALRRLWP